MSTTLKDVAKLAGVSPSTVSLVINNSPKISKRTKEKVLAAAKKLNYFPNARARAFVKKETRTIAFIIPDIHNLYFSEIAQAIKDVLRPLNYNLILCDTGNETQQERTYIDFLRQGGADGAIIASSSDLTALNDHLLIETNKTTPIVLIERTLPGDPLPTIDTNRLEGAKEAVCYLAEMGHRRIAFIGGYLENRKKESLRLQGFKEGLLEKNLPYRQDYILEGRFTIDGGFQAGKKLLTMVELPTAILAANDLIALGCINAITSAGLNVPKDISICGFDNLEISYAYNPPLTTVNIPKKLLGEKAAELLVSILNGETPSTNKFMFKTELIIRSSVARCSK